MFPRDYDARLLSWVPWKEQKAKANDGIERGGGLHSILLFGDLVLHVSLRYRG